jgi:predicted RNase H-like nuclease (RuvC/YqgF family)
MLSCTQGRAVLLPSLHSRPATFFIITNQRTMSEEFSKDVIEALENFNSWKRETEILASKLQSSSARLGELRTELSRLDHQKADFAKTRRDAANQLANGEIDENAFTETRKKYAGLSEKIDEAADLLEAFERAVDGLQGKFNDARAHVNIARMKANRAYAQQIQAEVKAKCGDLIMLGLAARHGGSSQTGHNGMGHFLCGVLTGNENRQPEYEGIRELMGEIQKDLGLED